MLSDHFNDSMNIDHSTAEPHDIATSKAEGVHTDVPSDHTYASPAQSSQESDEIIIVETSGCSFMSVAALVDVKSEPLDESIDEPNSSTGSPQPKDRHILPFRPFFYSSGVPAYPRDEPLDDGENMPITGSPTTGVNSEAAGATGTLNDESILVTDSDDDKENRPSSISESHKEGEKETNADSFSIDSRSAGDTGAIQRGLLPISVTQSPTSQPLPQLGEKDQTLEHGSVPMLGSTSPRPIQVRPSHLIPTPPLGPTVFPPDVLQELENIRRYIVYHEARNNGGK